MWGSFLNPMRFSFGLNAGIGLINILKMACRLVLFTAVNFAESVCIKSLQLSTLCGEKDLIKPHVIYQYESKTQFRVFVSPVLSIRCSGSAFCALKILTGLGLDIAPTKVFVIVHRMRQLHEPELFGVYVAIDDVMMMAAERNNAFGRNRPYTPFCRLAIGIC